MMRNYSLKTLLPILCFLFFGAGISSCNLIQKSADSKEIVQDASSWKNAIEVESNQAEYDWLNKNYPGYTLIDQELILKKDTPIDKITITTAEGEEKTFFFNISSFYNKGL